jgi:hypothetical protein
MKGAEQITKTMPDQVLVDIIKSHYNHLLSMAQELERAAQVSDRADALLALAKLHRNAATVYSKELSLYGQSKNQAVETDREEQRG